MREGRHIPGRRRVAIAAALAVLLSASSAWAISTPTTGADSSTTRAGTSTTRAGTPTTGADSSTAAPAQTTPTTTYVPSDGTPAPNGLPGAAPQGAQAGGTTAPPTRSTGATGGIGATGGTGATAAPGTAVPGGQAAPGATRTRAGARTGAAHSATHKRRLSTGWIIVAALGALLVLGCAAWGVARRRAYEPHWSLTFSHAMAEAGYRASATWAEFRDWARLGR
jgi:hypothetical protein